MNKVNENKENKSVEEKSNKSLGILLLFLFTIIPFWWVWLIIGVVKICQREGVKKFIKVQSKKAKQFIKTHKKVSAIVAVGLVGVVALAIAIPQIQSYLEKNREYFIDVEENMSFDCEATEEERTGQLACKERIITGTFSEYPTTKFSDAAIEINGDGFSKLFTHYIEESLYKTEDFDDVKLDSGIDMTIVVELYDSVVERNVIKKEISVHFDLNEDDVVLISQKNEEWKVWKKAEDERRAEEERKAEEKRKAEEAQRAEEERKAEEKRKAEEAKRAEEERRLEAQKNACSAKGAGYVWSDGECKYDISKDPSVPSIETISNACWLYGRNNGVRLLDYSSNEIVRDGNYFQIVMSHDDGSRWKCWYRPSDGDVFVEKIYSWL